MVELSRTVRFCLNGPGDGLDSAAVNGFSAWPAMQGLGRYYELHVRCQGEPDEQTGYLVNIKAIDAAVREAVLPALNRALSDAGDPAAIPMGGLMRRIGSLLDAALEQSVISVRLNLTPRYSLTLESDDMASVVMRQQFEFSAAHRLHVPSLSDERNREVFGKCNNPSGHGHNYHLEVAVRAPIDDAGHVCTVESLDRVVDEAVIEKLDHKHLNVDVAEFAELNPSVENIARVIHGILVEAVRKIGVELEEVSVWETGKTVCTYRGEPAAAAGT